MEEEPQSAFLKIEGNTPKNKVWDFLIVHSEYDYSMKDIAKFSKVSYTALKKLWKEFKDRGIVKQTRTVGKAKMYTLNRDSALVEAFIEYFWTVIDLETEKMFAEEDAEKEKMKKKAHARVAAAKRI